MGSHLYFAHPDHVVRNSSKRLAPGLDIRGDGGYCVVPPSVHENSEPYFWLGRDEGKPITTAPEWLLEQVSALDCRAPVAADSYDEGEWSDCRRRSTDTCALAEIQPERQSRHFER